MDTKLFLTIIIGILLLGGVFAQIVTATVIEPNNFTFTQTVTATVIEIQNITDTQIVTATVIEPTTIGNETYTPFCALEKENVTFYADVSGPCTEEVIFSIKRNGTWQNFTGEETAEGEDGFRDYSYEVYSCLLNSGLSEWKVYAKDCYGYTYNGSLNEFYVFPRTKLSIIPPEPQGENLWYTTSPRFTLENSDTDKIFYKWRNSNQIYFY
ncbi:MAG: hypothetical protein NTZ83_05205, partial [Candidatus Pacearchaeota archaeon]|nr:hypothetical protein [Candidatus Pacearchaeota archaeon]